MDARSELRRNANREKRAIKRRAGHYHPKKAMALTPELLRAHIDKHGPYAYHETALSNIDPILSEGIRTDDDFAEMGLGGTQRPGASYLWLPTRGERDHHLWPLRVDLRKLDPQRLINDEDSAETIYPEFPIDQMRGRGDLGDWLHTQHDFDSPERVMQGMQGGTVAYDGDIPPEAIERNPNWFANEENVRRYEQETNDHNAWRKQLQDVADSYKALQDRLNGGEFAGQLGNHVWTPDGQVYERSSSGNWFNTNPTPEDERAMYQQGIISDHMQKIIDAFGVPPGWGYDAPVSDSPGHTAAGSPEDVAEGWSPPSGPVDYSDGLGLGNKPETPVNFQMPPEIEQRYVAMMECPECHSNLRKGDNALYCEYCGWQPRQS